MERHYELVIGSSSWVMDDEVIQLRVAGSERVFSLPMSPRSGARVRQGRGEPRWSIGSSPECEIQLDDTSGNVAARHALLFRHGEAWLVLALSRSHVLGVDGVPQPAAQLVPGTELEVGGVGLIAESMGSIALRDFLKRLLGSSSLVVDSALRKLRLAQTQQLPLVLRGPEDLVKLARELHRRIYGESRPFVVYRELHQMFRDGAGCKAPELVDGAAALEAAQGGTLCLLTSSLPPDCDRVGEEHAAVFGSQTQVVICDDAGVLDVEDHGCITVPSIHTRSRDLLSVIFELGCEAMRALDLEEPFAVEDAVAVLCHDARSFLDILQATSAFAALRKTGSLFAAAELLQMEVSALRHWIGPRPLPWLRRDAAWDAN